MAAFDFPNAPVVDQVYIANGVSYKWDGQAWVGGPAVDNTRVLRTGDTMTGPLVIDPAPGSSAFINLDKPTSGQLSYVQGLMNGKSRWIMALGDSSAESGSNLGSQFGVWRYSDAGAFIDAPLQIARSTGNVTVPNALIVGPNSGGGSLTFIDKSASGQQGQISFRTAGAARWSIASVTDAESGGNAGSTFQIFRHNDAGTALDTPLSITRATGKIYTSNSLAVGTSFPAAGATADIGAHLFSPYMTCGSTLGLNAYVRAGPPNAWSAWQASAGGYVTIDASANITIGSGPNPGAGAPLSISARMVLYGAGYSYAQPRFLAFDGNVAGQAVVGCYQSSQSSAMGWLISGAGNYHVYNLDGAGGATGSPLLTVNRGQGLSNIGPNAQMGFYYDGGSAYLLTYAASNYHYWSTDWVLIMGAAERFRIRSDGLITSQNGAALKTLAGQWGAISDVRIKQNIRPYEAGLDEVLQLKPCWYQFRPETHIADADKDVIGLIAQEVETVMPECVTIGEGESGEIKHADMRTLDPTAIMYALVNAVKTLTARVAELEAAR
jgi:hypothetical protein